MITLDSALAPVHVQVPTSDQYLRPLALLSVAGEEGEEVEWIWTHFTDGRSVVTGYRIRSKWLKGQVKEKTNCG